LLSWIEENGRRKPAFLLAEVISPEVSSGDTRQTIPVRQRQTKVRPDVPG
jgi:hypothetical protein